MHETLRSQPPVGVWTTLCDSGFSESAPIAEYRETTARLLIFGQLAVGHTAASS